MWEVRQGSTRAEPMTAITITVPKPGVIPYMSANDRPNKWRKASQTQFWRQSAHTIAIRSGAPSLHGLVRIVATVHIADRRRREVSNLFPTFKACIDGFVDAGILADDSDAHVIGPDPRRAYDGPPRITFTLEEVAS